MSRDHYKGIPKNRNVVVRPDNLLDIEAIVKPKLEDNTPIFGLATASGTAFALESATHIIHQDVASASTLKLTGANAPALTEHGSLLYLSFDHAVDRCFRMFRISHDYIGSPSLHIHWTKSDDVDRSATFAKWRIDYSVFNGHNEEVNGGTFVETTDLEYLDSGTTTRVIYRSENMPLVGVSPNDYVSIKVSKVTPTGAELVDPGLVSVDLIYESYVNRA
jgi:hypothetical protein